MHLPCALPVHRIEKLWQWCCSAYLQHNIKLAFPKDTELQKTYQWRYLVALARKLDEWGFDDALAKQFITVVVNYAKRRKLHTKGLAIFHQGNVLQICYDKLKEQIKGEATSLSSVKATAAWFNARVANADAVVLLLQCERIGAYPNIVSWYQSGKLTEVYLSLSRACGQAMARLSQLNASDRAALPSAARLFAVRHQFLSDPMVKLKLRLIMGGDWRS